METQSLPIIWSDCQQNPRGEQSMATGTWDDFTDKYGFRDGASVGPRDFEARSTLVEVLNDHAAMKAAGLQALEYDRPGLHNPCLVVVVKGQGRSAAEL